MELEWLDFSARNYDPALGRWMNIDPLADAQYEYSPYHYTYNNPILYNDPTGMIGEYFGGRPVLATRVVNETTNEEINIDDGYDFTFYVSKDEFNAIRKKGSIEGTKAYWRWWWKAFVYEMKKSDGTTSGDILQFLIYDDIGDAITAASKKQYGSAVLTLAFGKLKRLRKLKEWVENNKGKKIPGTKKGGVTFENDGRGGGQVLPKKDADGNPITYKEYDINPTPKPGQTRGRERMVVGSDGRAYYTDDHYKTFTEIKD